MMSKITTHRIVIGGETYTLIFTKERQIICGTECFAAVDSDRSQIRLSSHIRLIINKAVAAARRAVAEEKRRKK